MIQTSPLIFPKTLFKVNDLMMTRDRETSLHPTSHFINRMHGFPMAAAFPCAPMGIAPQFFTVVPPLRAHPPAESFFRRVPVPLEIPRGIPQVAPEIEDDGIGLKERNRMAAQRWRERKNHYLVELEGSNDLLRKQALDLTNQLQLLKVENRVLESELAYFQSFMTNMIRGAK
jgi:hypothetical protein